MSWMMFFFFKQKTAYEMRISDWSSDVCSSDLIYFVANGRRRAEALGCTFRVTGRRPELWDPMTGKTRALPVYEQVDGRTRVALRLDEAGSCFVVFREPAEGGSTALTGPAGAVLQTRPYRVPAGVDAAHDFTVTAWIKPETDLWPRSEENTSET